jgi:predicted DNA-binding transcriptional regulator AlpA
MEHQLQTQPRYLRTEQAASYLGVSPATLHKKRNTGGGPPYCRPAGTRIVLYDVHALDAWMAEGTRGSTSEYDTPESRRRKPAPVLPAGNGNGARPRKSQRST